MPIRPRRAVSGGEGPSLGRLHSWFAGAGTSFIAVNRNLSRYVETLLPTNFTRHLHTVYKYDVARVIEARTGSQIILDIGSGKECPFYPFLSQPDIHLIVGLDFAESELRANLDLRHKVVADAAAPSFPLADRSADVVVSRSVVEHIHNNRAFFANCAKVLKPGGVLIHTFPGRFTPFAVVNRMLPNWLARRLLAIFHPAWIDECGFRVFYDRCYYSAVKNLLMKDGFFNIQFSFRFYQSIYFDFFVPLFIIMLIYDLTIWVLGIRNLACGLIVRAELGAAAGSGSD